MPDDAIGAMCRDYHEQGEAVELVERDDDFIEPTPGPEAYFADYEDWGEVEQAATEWVEGRVLDVGCGPGRHALYFQREGHDVTGIDVSPGAVEVARERGVEDARVLDVADVTDLKERYDTAIMMGNNFGLVGSAERAPEILDGLARVTTDDATLVASSMDPEATDDEAHLEYHERNRERGRLPGRVRIRVRYRRKVGAWHDYLHVAPETMRSLVAETPWSVAEVIGDDHYVARLTKD